MRVASILVVLAAGGRALFGRRGGREGPFAQTRWSTLPAGVPDPGVLRAVLYQVDDAGRCPEAGLQQLRRLAGAAIPLLPFRLERGRSRLRTPAPAREPAEMETLELTPGIDPAALLALVDRDLRVIELRQRLRRTTAEARDREATLIALAAIVRATGGDLEPPRVIDLAMDRARGFFKIRAWLFLQADAERGTLTVERTGGEGVASMKGRALKLDEGLAGRAALARQPVIVDDLSIEGGPSGAPELPPGLGARPALAVPLLSRGRVVGVVEAIHQRPHGRFRIEDARLLSLLLEPAAVAIDNALLLRRSEELSVTDDLTKLYNSRYLNATLRREVERSKRYRTPVSLIFLDLDGFKGVNDQHGHLWGSRTLVEVGRAIHSTVREIDVVARFGGDEFTVILPQTGPEGAQTIAERIRQRIADTVFLEAHGLRVRITASIGIASFPDHGRTKDDLIARADQAMYVVKSRGKNGVALAPTDAPWPAVVATVR